MPDPTTPPPPAEIDGDAFSSALQASAPQIGQPPGAVPPAEVTPPPAPAPAPETAKPTEEKPKPADAPKKKGLDALPEEEVEKKDEEKPKAAEPEEPEVDTSKWAKAQQEAFASARVKEKRLKQQILETQTRAEKLQKELEQAKVNPKDSEKTLKELEELRSWKNSQDLRSTPEWEETITKPVQKSLDVLNRIAGRAKVDADALMKATDEEDQFDRIDAINKVFEAAEEPVPAHLVSAAIQEAEKLHPLYAKGMELQKKAGETLASLKHQTEQQKAEAAKSEEAEYVKHHDHIYGQMAKKLPSLFGKPEVPDEVKAARPATDPADKAFQAQAAALLPSMAQELFALRAELAKEKASKNALLGTRPGVTPSATTITKPVNPDDVEMDEQGLADAMKTLGRR